MFRILARAAGVCALLLVLAAGGAWLERDRIESWLRARALKLYIERIAPQLPFTIEKLEITQASWQDLRRWKIPGLEMVVRKDDWRAYLSGPIELLHPTARPSGTPSPSPTPVPPPGTTSFLTEDQLFVLRYSPEARFEPVGHPDQISPPVQLTLGVGAIENFTHLKDVADLRGARVRAEAAAFDWPLFQLKLRDAKIAATWDTRAHSLALNAETAEAAWTRSAPDVGVIKLKKTALTLKSSLGLKPFSLGPLAEVTLRTGADEILWNELYLEIPGDRLPLDLTAQLNGQVALKLGSSRERLTLNVQTEPKLSGAFPPRLPPELHLHARWDTTPLDLAALARAATHAAESGGPLAPLARVAAFGIRAGRLKTAGEGTLTLPFTADAAENRARAEVELDAVTLEPTKTLRLSAIRAHATAETGPGFSEPTVNLRVRADQVRFRHIKAALNETVIRLEPTHAVAIADPARPATPPSKHTFRIMVQGAADASRIPLLVDGIPLQLGAPSGELGIGPFNLALETSLSIPMLEVHRILDPLCVPSAHIPPIGVGLQFPKIEVTEDSVDPTGSVHAELFGGRIDASEIGFFNLGTEVPETDFDLVWDNIQLDQLGNWVGFGEMDGMLTGHAKDVTIQAWLPTHYDFRSEVKPLHRYKIVFSPDAMKNVVHLFAGDGIDHLPGIADWLAFGWPSRFLGGYDVQYAGVSVFSNEGMILLETLDPPEMAKLGKHFFLYGPRFKMPLKSSHYPLIADNTAMGNMARRMAICFMALAKQKRASSGDPQGKETGRPRGKESGGPRGKETETKDESEANECLPPTD